MNSAFRYFILNQLYIVIILAGLINMVPPYFNVEAPSISYVYLLVIFLFSLTAHLFLKQALKNKNPQVFIRSFMLSMTLKMFAALLLLTITVYLGDRSEAKIKIIIFSLIYFFFFISDIGQLKKMLRSVKN